MGMTGSNNWQDKLREQPWLLFLIQQATIFLTALVLLRMIRAFLGKTSHGGKDPFGLLDLGSITLLIIAQIVFTYWLYHRVAGKDATPLGIKFTPRAALDLIAGTVICFLMNAWPYLVGALFGTAHVTDRVTAHFSGFALVTTFALAAFVLLMNSIHEEITSRAFPMRIWQSRSLWFQILVPSIIFAAIHLADEQFDLERFWGRTLMGIVFSVGYALTNNIWLCTGLHTGSNFAVFYNSGRWQNGALVNMDGNPICPEWASDIIWSVIVIVMVIKLEEKRKLALVQNPAPEAVTPATV